MIGEKRCNEVPTGKETSSTSSEMSYIKERIIYTGFVESTKGNRLLPKVCHGKLFSIQMQRWRKDQSEEGSSPDIELLEHLFMLENKTNLIPHYTEKIEHEQWQIRSYVVDWLFEISARNQFHVKTTQMAINYVDQVLNLISLSVSIKTLRTIGIVALMIADKYDKGFSRLIISPYANLTPFVRNTFSMYHLESVILCMLGDSPGRITSYDFISFLCSRNNLSVEVRYMALYFSELALVEGRHCTDILPSAMGYSAVVLARYIITGDTSLSLVYENLFCLHDVKKIINFLHKIFIDASLWNFLELQDSYSPLSTMKARDLKPLLK